MTEKLYYNDSHISTFTARVISCELSENSGNRFHIVLDRSAFFPGGGGQPADTGELVCDGFFAAVLDAYEKDGEIVHITDAALPSGAEVNGRIDYELRFRRMQNHSGEHMLSGIAHSLYKLNNVGFHMGSSDITLDLDGELDDSRINELEKSANQAVYENVCFRTLFPDENELAALSYRSKKEIDGKIRLIVIDNYDCCACCAPHVSRSGEIGIIRIISHLRYKGGMRLHILCGADALDYIRKESESVRLISCLLSAKRNEVYEAVCALQELSDSRARTVALLKGKLADNKIASLTAGDGCNTVIFSEADEFTPQDIRRIVNAGAELCSGICALFYGSDGNYGYVMASKSVNLSLAARDINAALSGKGGGSPTMIQGSVNAEKSRISRYFKDKAL